MQRHHKSVGRIAATAAVCLVVLVSAATPSMAFVPPYSPTFPDVPTTHTFYTEIEWLAAEGITTGYSDGLYKPVNAVSRQAIAAFIYRYETGHVNAPPCNTAPFTDVPKTHPFCGQIKWAKTNGIVQGYPDGSFHPAEAVARQALAAFMYRLDGSPNGPDPGCSVAPFPDVPKTHPFCGEIKWAKDNNIVQGYSDGTYKPVNPVTRQAFAAILYNYDFIHGGSSVSVLSEEPALPSAVPGDPTYGLTPGADGATPTGVITGGSNGLTLPITGRDTISLVVIGILLIGGGAVVVYGTRRRFNGHERRS